MPDPATPSAVLAPIRERSRKATAREGDTAEWLGAALRSATEDVPLLVTGYEALLKLADDWEAKAEKIGAQIALEDCDGASAGFKMIGYQNHRDHAKALRAAIGAALTGKEGTEDG